MNLAFFIAFSKVIFLITGYTGYIKSFGKTLTAFSISIDHIVRCALVILLKNSNVDNILPDKRFIRNLHHLHRTSFGKSDNVIEAGTVKQVFIFLQTGSD